MRKWEDQRKKNELFEIRNSQAQAYERSTTRQDSQHSHFFRSSNEASSPKNTHDEIDNFLGLPANNIPIFNIQSKKTHKLVQRLKLNTLDTELNFLEHIYMRPITETKYFLTVKKDSDAEGVTPTSGAILIQRMEDYDLPEYDHLYRKINSEKLIKLSKNIDELLNKQDFTVQTQSSSSDNVENKSFQSNALEVNFIRMTF